MSVVQGGTDQATGEHPKFRKCFKYDTAEEERVSSSIHHSSSPSKSKFSLDNAVASGMACMDSGLTRMYVQGGTDQAAGEHQKFKEQLQV